MISLHLWGLLMIPNKIINNLYISTNKPQEPIENNDLYLYQGKNNRWHFTCKNNEDPVLDVEIEDEEILKVLNELKINTLNQETQIQLVSLLLPIKRQSEISIAFDYAEHYNIGQTVQKLICEHLGNDDSLKEGKVKLKNGLNIEISELYGLMGDFFGLPDEPISLKNTLQDQKNTFLKAFETLNNAPPEKVKEILRIGNIQKQAVSIAIQNCTCTPKSSCTCAEKALEEVSALTNKLWNKATGGSYYLYPIVQGTYLKLSKNNLDHFSTSSHASYKAGHELALSLIEKVAIEYKKDEPDHKLISQLTHQALAIEASAGHYLTDSFSSGHTRVPRKALYELRTLFGLPVPAAITGLFTLVMHNEDSDNGLWLKDDSTKDVWKAYGDDSLLTGKGQDNRKKVNTAAQTGMLELIGELKKANRTISTQDNFPSKGTVYTLLPSVDEEKNPNQPLFKEDQTGKLLRRKNVNDINCKEYISDWNVGSTLAILMPQIISYVFPSVGRLLFPKSQQKETITSDPNTLENNTIDTIKGSNSIMNGLMAGTKPTFKNINNNNETISIKVDPVAQLTNTQIDSDVDQSKSEIAMNFR